MALDVEDVIAGLDPAERRKVEEMAAELIAEEMTLRELRKARRLTQASVARELGISQDAISRLEQRSDLLLSTLRRTVEGDGRQPLARRPLPRPPPGRACRHRRARCRRLTPARPAPAVFDRRRGCGRPDGCDAALRRCARAAGSSGPVEPAGGNVKSYAAGRRGC